MAGTLKVGGKVLATHNSETDEISLNDVSHNNRLVQILKNSNFPSINNDFVSATTFAWGNAGTEIQFTPSKIGNLLLLQAHTNGYNDYNDTVVYGTFFISNDANGSGMINIQTDSNGHGATQDFISYNYFYSGTDWSFGGNSMIAYYTVQNTNLTYVRNLYRVTTGGRMKLNTGSIMIIHEYEVA
jgi:hypothetical protein